MKEIFNRRSIRKFKDQAVEPEKVDKLLRAAMQAPSAANQQPWEFIVVQDKEKLAKVAGASAYAKPVASCGVAFVLLADERVMKVPTAWQQDMGACAENLLLEAVHLDLGGVWLGVSVSEETSNNVSSLFDLPDNIKPYALIAVGYPEDQKNEFVDRYNAAKVHHEKW